MKTDAEMATLNAKVDRLIEEVRAHPDDAQLWLNCRVTYQAAVMALQERIAEKAKTRAMDEPSLL